MAPRPTRHQQPQRAPTLTRHVRRDLQPPPPTPLTPTPRTPATAYHPPKATPGSDPPTPLPRPPRPHQRRQRIPPHRGRLHHIGIGRTLDGTPVLLLIDDLDVRVIHATTGEIIRPLTINPNRRYHGTGNTIGGPKGPENQEPEP